MTNNESGDGKMQYFVVEVNFTRGGKQRYAIPACEHETYPFLQETLLRKEKAKLWRSKENLQSRNRLTRDEEEMRQQMELKKDRLLLEREQLIALNEEKKLKEKEQEDNAKEGA